MRKRRSTPMDILRVVPIAPVRDMLGKPLVVNNEEATQLHLCRLALGGMEARSVPMEEYLSKGVRIAQELEKADGSLVLLKEDHEWLLKHGRGVFAFASWTEAFLRSMSQYEEETAP